MQIRATFSRGARDTPETRGDAARRTDVRACDHPVAVPASRIPLSPVTSRSCSRFPIPGSRLATPDTRNVLAASVPHSVQKSMPTVARVDVTNSSLMKRSIRHDLPVPESP